MEDFVKAAKAIGAYRLAGALDRLNDRPCHYGCHVGMKSTYNRAISEYRDGWNEIDAALNAKAN